MEYNAKYCRESKCNSDLSVVQQPSTKQSRTFSNLAPTRQPRTRTQVFGIGSNVVDDHIKCNRKKKKDDKIRFKSTVFVNYQKRILGIY